MTAPARPRRGRPRALTDHAIAEIRQARRSGTPVRVLADRHGVAVHTIYRYITDLQEPEQ